MKNISKQSKYLCLGLFIPFCYLLSPSWLSISGIGPSWAILWLIPWSIEQGPLLGAFGGLCVALAIDSVVLTGVTQIPVLVLLGFWWGRIGLKGPLIENSLNLALLAFLGCLLNGISIWLQNLLLLKDGLPVLFNANTFHTVLAYSIITSLIAPIFCSIALIKFFRRNVN